MTRLKVCGITRAQDAELATELGAWALGMIFWPGSPRRCDPAVAAGIARALKRRVEVAGVFVDARLDHVAALAEGVGLTLIQLHGDEGPAYCAEVARRTGAKVIKAARVRSRAEILALGAFHVDFRLLDTARIGMPGGTGETWDWRLLARRGRGDVPVLLSGGLKPENVEDAIAAVRPWAVDVSSGVEAQPGKKDPERLEAFVAAVNRTAAVNLRGAAAQSAAVS